MSIESKTELEALVEEQRDVVTRINSFISNFNKSPKDRITLGYLATRSVGIKELWVEFTTLHRSIVTQSTAKIRKSHQYFVNNEFAACEEAYFDISGRIAEKQLKLVPPVPVPTTSTLSDGASSSAAISPAPKHIQLPRLNVPTFSGTYEDWQSFHDLFVAAVHSNPNLHAAQKLQYLKSLLQGTAETVVKHIQITDANYAIAWKALVDRFNNKRAIVNTHLGKLLTQRAAEETATSIRTLIDTTNECRNALNIQQIDTTTWDSILVYIVSQRIPKPTLDLWEQSLDGNDIPSFNALLEFLEHRFRTLEFSPAQSIPNQSRFRSKPQSFHAATATCRVCNGAQHALRLCPRFIEMDPSQRITHANKAKLCKNCLAFSHATHECKSNGRCNVCNQRHHSMLHLNINQPTMPNAQSIANAAVASVASGPSASQQIPSPPITTLMTRPTGPAADDSILATALVTITAFNGIVHTFRALLDNASQESFISKRLVQFLGIKPRSTSLAVSGVGQTPAPKPLGQVDLAFGSPHDPTFMMNVSAIVLPIITYNLPSKQLSVPTQLIANIQLADPTYGTPNSVDMLLSATVFAALTLPSIRKEESTIALQTKLGWVLYGSATTPQPQSHRSCFHVMANDDVSKALQKFWQLEEVETVKPQSAEDVKCEQTFALTHSRNVDGRYCVHLPFKSEPHPPFGPSRDRAVSRFLQIERKLSKDDKLRADYTQCIHEYLQLGHMHPTSITEKQHRFKLPDGTSSYNSYYLPHHAVVKTDSSTTKLRVVFDASTKTLNGPSLNDMLLIGPVIQDTLFDLLLRWRTHRVVIKADIEKMYRQVLVHETHQPFQRIIWRDNPNEPLQDYQLRTVTFGTSAAPYLAIKTLHQLADDEEHRFPIGAQAVRHDFYVDDLLSGADTVANAQTKQKEIIELLRTGGFQIRKWSSNHNHVTDWIDDAAKEIYCSPDSSLKTLGILWSPRQDTLFVKVINQSTEVSTKRQLLSEISKLFDPLGWIAPVIISMKILLQKLWLAGLAWDDQLPTSIISEWTTFQSHLSSLEQIRINRWLNTSPNHPIEVHGFSDASEKAYAAAIYVRVQMTDNSWATHLIAAKTRVAPVKQVSLPRLELCAAVLLAQLLKTITRTLNASSTYAWTDSEIVLAWLQGHPNRWNTFVANRISLIHEVIDASAWHHVPTKENPADSASRGIPPHQLVDHPLWWHGPPWLSKNKESWPSKHTKVIASTTMECKKSQSFMTTPINDSLTDIINKYSTIAKAERVVAYIRRCMVPRRSLTLLVAEVVSARNLLIQHTQRTHFNVELSDLASQRPLQRKSKLLPLSPFMGDDQLLRVGGRLHHADIPFDNRHPIILPKSSRFTDLIIDEAHSQTMHGGASVTLAHLRNRYWIVDARNAVRHRIHKCNTCFKFGNPCLKQLMGNLPKPRVTACHPFGHTGLDYAGPIMIRMRRQPGRPVLTKGYICLFICLATKAIHLELVGDMSSATFLAALNRFTSRRGLPSDMYSDNGTYFVRAARDIEHDMQQVRKTHTEEAANLVSQTGIQWHFIPPAAPHFGGLWEAGIKSTKFHLKRCIGDGILTYEEMATTLCQIESCLNSRPLCPMSADPNDYQILTPGHFLVGRPLLARPQPSVLEIPANKLDHWQKIYYITEQFWRQWQNEYLVRMQQRPKWLSEAANITTGELVLLKEDNLPPTQWKLARVIETHPGSDGLTRVVTLQTPTTTLKRPIVKICKLPTQ